MHCCSSSAGWPASSRPVSPGGYWVGVVLLINLTLGGVIRIRKGWKHAGNLISHLGIIFMLVAGGVAHHFSERGNMAMQASDLVGIAHQSYNGCINALILLHQFPHFHKVRGQ